MGNFKERLYGKKSFLYQVKDDYYAIGANTFAKVTDSPEVDNLELLRNALNKENERQIAKYLDKTLRIANAYRVDAKEHFKLQDKLFRFLDELEQNDVEAYQSLQNQLFQLEDLLARYYNE